VYIYIYIFLWTPLRILILIDFLPVINHIFLHGVEFIFIIKLCLKIKSTLKSLMVDERSGVQSLSTPKTDWYLDLIIKSYHLEQTP